MAKTFGLDLGTASIGYTCRSTDNENGIIGQLNKFGSVIFQKGVGNSKTGEFSYAAERTKHRSSRRLYQARKYRIWQTLQVLIEYGFCPLSVEDLDKWRKYDKEKELKRQYPTDAKGFEQWVRLDFDGDGKADYSSPYQLRAELATTQLDFSSEINRFKLGRALYHIAQRRGFKSSKGETLKEQEETTKEILDDSVELDIASLKKSEEKKSKDLVTYMQERDLKTVGCSFAQLEKEGVRVRASIYQAVRSQYKEEIKYIFEFQNGLDTNSEFFSRIYSDRKDGSIFYKRPLCSQKGSVGTCTLEPTKPRCPISHPEFEKFRAFAFINNVQYRKTTDGEWQNLTAEQKIRLYKDKFLLTKSNFKFEEIRKWLEEKVGMSLSRTQKKNDSTINYSDKTNVSGCPVSGRLKNLLGNDWENFVYETSEKRKNKNGNEHSISFSAEDIWHVCFSFDDEEAIYEFAKSKLNFDDKKAKLLVKLWIAIPQGYGMLSLKAVKNINKFLVPNIENILYQGFIYTEAALLAKIPEILGEKLWQENEKDILKSISDLINKNREEKRILNIANNLISVYKSLEYNEQFAYKNVEYLLDDSDKAEVEKYTIEAIGEKTWEREIQENKEIILKEVAEKYQQFFATSKRDYFRLPKLGDTLKLYLADKFTTLHYKNHFINPDTNLHCQCDACKKLSKLYHPSMIEFYKPAEINEDTGLRLLESPIIGAFKNPMAMRTLHELRKLVNYFIEEGVIDEETRVVVETARDLNDANMRWAIEAYQREREAENKQFGRVIQEIRNNDKEVVDDDIDKIRLCIEQVEDEQDKEIFELKKIMRHPYKKKNERNNAQKKLLNKYRLWLEQGMKCIYTGKLINISNLFDDNSTDFEHTIPRSQSFDNSLANQTICDAYYNRHIKKNRIPTQLPNYNKSAVINGTEYSAIEPRLDAWKEKVSRLEENVEFWKLKSKKAQDKDTKDNSIRQKHLWQMELDYWQDKLSRFTMTEVTSGFKHSQLNDTRLITKYAYHYLKSVFSKVEVQKGSVTADFRKMLGVQSVYEKKNRDKHSHHAIDAAILSLIPVAAKRDKMLELFYEIQEERKLNRSTENLEQKLQNEIKNCQIGDISDLVKYIEDNILISHVSKDQTLTPAKRKERKRGKVIWLKDEKGEICKDEKGNEIPKHWIQGDCIRGQLHKESFYGAITQAQVQEKKDANGKVVKDKNGRTILTFMRDDKGKILIRDEKFYVIRRELKYKKNDKDKGFKNLEELRDCIVDKNLFEIIRKQCQEKAFKDACEAGFYMIDKNENKVNKIRHIRCFTSVKNPLSIKKQTYLSDKEYKQNYYAEVGDLYVMCCYYNSDKTKTQYEIIKLFDVSENRKYNLEDIANVIEVKNEKFFLGAKLQAGKQVLLYEKNIDELKEMSNDLLSDRLYVILGFENSSTIKLKKHINAQPDKDLGKGENIKDFNSLPQKIRCSVNTLSFLLEGKDFEMKLDGTIEFK
ncbi:MAG: hypothetical protein LBQ31_01425 [Bacteroidales bacterium]|jgi:CRISPR-associated endonuclease Csn1|nr:hypothetical protein [Bacteroidales bacterium]